MPAMPQTELLIEQERQLAVDQLAGTAAHQLGQPLAAIMLNVHLLKSLDSSDPKFKQALQALNLDAKRMADLIEKLKSTDASKTQDYYGDINILNIDDQK